MEKNKEEEPPKPFGFRVHRVDLDNGETSCVCVADALRNLTAPALQALAKLSKAGMGYSDWLKATGLPETSFRRALNDLTDSAKISKGADGRYYRQTQNGGTRQPPTAT